jgi:hypothetical protein
MEKQKESQENVREDGRKKAFLNVDRIGLNTLKYKCVKRYICIGGVAVVALLFSGCFPGYISSEPTYTETSRPSTPSDVHVWVEGNWEWNRSNQTYVHRDGHWSKPHHSRKFIAGHWTSSERGHRWVNGHWER